MVFVPWELINEILLKLPLKSVVRLRCVCKSWLILISDPHFAISHFERATTAARQERLMLLAPSVPQFRSIDFNESLHDDSASAPLNLNFLLPYPPHVLIVGSCRGFLLLSTYDDRGFYLWNPFTGVHKQVSLSPFESDADRLFSRSLYGFWYDPLTDDYMVVQATCNLRDHRASHVEFFSLRANAWKQIEIESYKYRYTFSENQIGWLLKGVIHWLAINGDVSMNVILAFDLTEKSFSEVPLPVGFEYTLQVYILKVLTESLSLCCVEQNNHSASAEIWVMKEYKVQSSWTKTIVVSVDNIPTWHFFPLCFTKSGDIVGTDMQSGLMKCNDKGQLLEHRSCFNFNDAPNRPTVAVYTQSLFSLPCDRRQDD